MDIKTDIETKRENKCITIFDFRRYNILFYMVNCPPSLSIGCLILLFENSICHITILADQTNLNSMSNEKNLPCVHLSSMSCVIWLRIIFELTFYLV